jgi:quinol monooxygenase YgiN
MPPSLQERARVNYYKVSPSPPDIGLWDDRRGLGALRNRDSSSYLRRHVLEDHAMSELIGIARFKFREGRREEYLRLSEQASEIVRTKDSGTLQYDLYLNGDQSECMFIERYRDSEAAIEHAANLGHLFAAVLDTVSVVHGELLGEPSAELRAKLAGSEVPVLFTPYRR